MIVEARVQIAVVVRVTIGWVRPEQGHALWLKRRHDFARIPAVDHDPRAVVLIVGFHLTVPPSGAAGSCMSSSSAINATGDSLPSRSRSRARARALARARARALA